MSIYSILIKIQKKAFLSKYIGLFYIIFLLYRFISFHKEIISSLVELGSELKNLALTTHHLQVSNLQTIKMIHLLF